MKDFEGYRVYVGRDTRRASFTLLSSFDFENYDRWTAVERADSTWVWKKLEQPFTLDSLRALYNAPDFDPLIYTREQPLEDNGTYYRFSEHDWNRSDLGLPRSIRKVYPDAIKPDTDSSLWLDDEVTREHGKPLPKFYEYEYTYDNLLPTVPYFVSVTSFDHGFAAGGIPSKEGDVTVHYTESYAQMSADSVEAYQLDAYVYPNPYLVDAAYAGRGYENREGSIIPDRARLIHFSNLPKVCTISIFSLDGDLIGKIDHNYPSGGPEAMHDWWNLVSRSGLAVTSGLYYWVVESESRTQIGKLVILK